jgi:hypothetical protein
LCGYNIIAGEKEHLYKQIILDALSNEAHRKNIKIHLWDGFASKRIMEILDNMFERGVI